VERDGGVLFTYSVVECSEVSNRLLSAAGVIPFGVAQTPNRRSASRSHLISVRDLRRASGMLAAMSGHFRALTDGWNWPTMRIRRIVQKKANGAT